jgi:hypothetical protein
MKNFHFSNECFDVIIRGVSHNGRIEKFDIGNNSTTIDAHKSMDSLTRLIKTSESITDSIISVLSLRGYYASIVNDLRVNRTLLRLNIFEHLIGVQAVFDVIEAVKNVGTVQYLNVAWNNQRKQ